MMYVFTLRQPEVPIGEVSVIPQACRVSIPMLQSHTNSQFSGSLPGNRYDPWTLQERAARGGGPSLVGMGLTMVRGGGGGGALLMPSNVSCCLMVSSVICFACEPSQKLLQLQTALCTLCKVQRNKHQSGALVGPQETGLIPCNDSADRADCTICFIHTLSHTRFVRCTQVGAEGALHMLAAHLSNFSRTLGGQAAPPTAAIFR